ncbi:thiamine pyrophosphate-dependent enzyme [Rhizobium sp. BK491]|uniref:thiamine pyrophosphate-dependent enzyme n=1 Tax=Rhizobium sp. BK491 TaxID=2587009 RepID=UPI0016127527|nr:thiamine pyrophosphate-dependent enzyme [Rhizobium sp. BK491]MBB3568835.1 acetolactate synthase-1/2/3 large subunit [Rhizobium sp. BK491]
MTVNLTVEAAGDVQVVKPKTGYEFLIDTLATWHVRHYAGVTGGGVIHLLKHLEPMVVPDDGVERPVFFNVGEYVAGFIPLGYYLASGKISAAIATTGAATRLLTCGLSDAKLHNIPAIYLIPLSPADTRYRAPLQDTSADGADVVAQLRAELPSGTFVLNDPDSIEEQLEEARKQLDQGSPIALLMPPEALGKVVPEPVLTPWRGDYAHKPNRIDHGSLAHFLAEFPRQSAGRRVIVLAGEEAAVYPYMPVLTTRLCKALQAPIVWSINGANAVARNNSFGFGYLGFGGNDRAMQLWKSLGPDDIVITLGFCPDEYTLNFSDIPAHTTWNFTNLTAPYGSVGGEFRHRVGGEYFDVRGPIDQVLSEAIGRLEGLQLPRPPAPAFVADLNDRKILPPRAGTIDIARFYQELDCQWQSGSIAFDDVCLAYKDRQYVTQRPHPNVRFHSLYRGSAMGGALGAAIGAKLAKPEATVFAFMGDGCFRLIAGCLAEARSLGLVLFVLDNGALGIMVQGLPVVIPDYSSDRYHSDLYRIDFGLMARACGWTSRKLMPDLSNLAEIMRESYSPGHPSILVEVPVDAEQVVGQNPRANNL